MLLVKFVQELKLCVIVFFLGYQVYDALFRMLLLGNASPDSKLNTEELLWLFVGWFRKIIPSSGNKANSF